MRPKSAIYTSKEDFRKIPPVCSCPAHSQASSRYPSYKRRLGTGCDSANFRYQTQYGYGKRRPAENGPFLKAWEQIAFSEMKLKFQVVFFYCFVVEVADQGPSCSKDVKRYPPDKSLSTGYCSAIGFPNTYPLDSDLSGPGCSNIGDSELSIG